MTELQRGVYPNFCAGGRVWAAAAALSAALDTGLPDSMARERSALTWYAHACEFIDHRWPGLSAKGRLSVVEGLVAVTVALVKPGKEGRDTPDPAVLRRALRRWASHRSP